MYKGLTTSYNVAIGNDDFACVAARDQDIATQTKNTLAASTTISNLKRNGFPGACRVNAKTALDSYPNGISHSDRSWSSVPVNKAFLDVGGNAPLNESELQALSGYKSHAVEDLKNASLMNRVDSKFVIPRGYLSALLLHLQDKYTVLEIDGLRDSRYYNCYFDTEHYTHYLAHHNRRANRYKLRQRTYRDSGTSFLEVKFRNNHGRTIKTRVQLDGEKPVLNAQTTRFINESGIAQYGSLAPTQIGTYTRIALANEAAGERVTIDADLAIQDLKTGNMHEVGDWVIVEVKQGEFNRHAPFFGWARQQGLRRCSFSKYCMGIYYTGPRALKRNNFHRIDRQMAVSEKRYTQRMSLTNLWPDTPSGLVQVNP